MSPPDPIIQEAFHRAVKNFKQKLNNDDLYNQIKTTDSIDKVYDATDELQRDQGKSRRRLQNLNRIQPYLEGLRSYTGAIDTFVQAKPDILALIWGPIKLLLQWASNLTEAFEALVKTTAEIGRLLPEFKEMAAMFDQNQQIKDLLVLFFSDILDFYLVALEFFGMKRIKFMFEALWPRTKDKIKLVITHIERHQSIMRNEVRLESLRAEYDERQRAFDRFEEMRRHAQKTEFDSIKADVAPEFYDARFSSVDSRTCKGTGTWLLEDDTFKKWLTNSSERVLWLQGIPGAGKTFLAGTMIREAMRSRTRIFAFLSHTKQNTSAISILHSLIFQLALQNEILQAVLTQAANNDLKNDLKEAQKLLQTLLGSAGPVYIVIDGLDEIDVCERRSLLTHLLQTIEACTDTRLAVSSRVEDDISRQLRPVSASIVIGTRNTASIEAFVSSWKQTWFEDHDFASNDQDAINEHLRPLASKADGMFLYARIVLECVEYLFDINDILQELSRLPEDLDEAYGRILARVNSQPNTAKSLARTILGWVACSPTPMTVYEMEQALVVHKNSGSERCSSGLRTRLNQLCGPVVEIVQDYVVFVHFTVKTYLTNPKVGGNISLSEATLNLAVCCLRYLSQDHHNVDIEETRLQQLYRAGTYRLHHYTVSRWLILVEQYLRLVDVPSETLPAALQCFWEARGREHSGLEAVDGGVQSSTLPLAWMRQNHTEVCERLVRAMNFHSRSQSEDLNLNEIDHWKMADPLRLWAMSARLRGTLNQTACRVPGDCTAVECICAAVQSHDTRPFRCTSLACSKSYHGFSTKSDCDYHTNKHDRPWKCAEPTCSYASTGFSFQRFRDMHQKSHVMAEAKPAQASLDNREAIILDLIALNNVPAVRELLALLNRNENWGEWMEAAAGCAAGPAMLDVISKSPYKPTPYLYAETASTMLDAAFDANLENVDWIMEKCFGNLNVTSRVAGLSRFITRVSEIDLQEQSRLLERVKSYIQMWVRGKSFAKAPFDRRTFKVTKGDPGRENAFIQLWPYADAAQATRGLLETAATTRSIPLAKFFLGRGGNINKRQGNSMSVLYHACWGSSQQAADFAHFLLHQGAKPETPTIPGTKRRLILVQEMQNWLGLTWEELLQKVKEDRETGRPWEAIQWHR